MGLSTSDLYFLFGTLIIGLIIFLIANTIEKKKDINQTSNLLKFLGVILIILPMILLLKSIFDFFITMFLMTIIVFLYKSYLNFRVINHFNKRKDSFFGFNGPFSKDYFQKQEVFLCFYHPLKSTDVTRKVKQMSNILSVILIPLLITLLVAFMTDDSKMEALRIMIEERD